MRVSAAGWLYSTIEDTRKYARLSAEVTHNHPEGIKGAEATASAIFITRNCSSKDNLIDVLDAIRQRMHADGHFIFPVLADEEDENSFTFRAIQTKDGKLWQAAFTSHAEYEKGEPSRVISNFIDITLKGCLESEVTGFIINHWGQSFMLARELIEMIFKADGDVEYSVPDEPDSLIGKELTSHDEVRFIPDILQNGEEFFFPVFTAAEEMGEYGDGFSKYQAHFLHAANLARNNEKKVSGIVINALSEPFVVPN